jgi:hypothetical protein
MPKPAVGLQSRLDVEYPVVLPSVVQQPVCDADHSPQASADFKNEWNSTSVPLYGVQKDKFAVIFWWRDVSMLLV